jgi:peptidoglycan/LPS O-acetylase OafA/YrhL
VALADIRGEPSPWRSRRAVQLGELSFAFYMIHMLVIRTGEFVFRYHPKEGWLLGSTAALAAFAVSLAAAWLLHRYVEVPLHDRISAWPGSRPGRTPRVSAPADRA